MVYSGSSTSSEDPMDDKISTPQHKNPPPNAIKSNISTPSKPSSSVKRPRETEEKEGTKPSSRKRRATKTTEMETKSSREMNGKKVETSPKKSGPIWIPKDEVGFLNSLAVCSQRGKGLPKNMALVFDHVRSMLDGEYSNAEMSNKMKHLKSKFKDDREKVKDEGFGFKSRHDETVYRLSKQVWGKVEEEEEEEKGRKKKKAVVRDLEEEEEEEEEKKDRQKKAEEGEEEEEEKKDRQKKAEEKTKKKKKLEGEEEEEKTKKKKKKLEGEEEEEKKKKKKKKKKLEEEEEEEEKKKKKKKLEEEEEEGEAKKKKHVVDDGDEEVEEKKKKKKKKKTTKAAEKLVLEDEDEEQKSSAKKMLNTSSKDVEMIQKEEEDEDDDESESDAKGNSVQHIADNAVQHVSNGLVGAVRDGIETTQESAEEEEEEDGSESDTKEIKALNVSDAIPSNDIPSNNNRSVPVNEEEEEDDDDDGESESDSEENKVLHVANSVPHQEKGLSVSDAVFGLHFSNGVQKQSKDLGPRVSNGNLNNGSRRSADSDPTELIQLLCDKNKIIMDNFRYRLRRENQNMANHIKEDIRNIMREAIPSSSNNRTYGKVQFSCIDTINRISSARGLTAMSNTEAGEFEQKWREQQAVEEEVNIKRLSLLQEELQLRMAKLRHPLRN